MGANRRYGEACAIATALDYVGERWALLVVRELLLGPKRFRDLQDGLPGAGSKVLVQRLRELESGGVVQRRMLPPPASTQVYELTEWGAQLDPLVTALGQWGADAPERGGGYISADSAVIRLRSYFTPTADQPWDATYELRLGRYIFSARVADGRLVAVWRGEPHDPPGTIIKTDPETLSRVVGDGDEDVDAAEHAGRLSITGDHQAGRRLLEAARN
jgi:DNA-binding HxlR family transcriptional regulator